MKPPGDGYGVADQRCGRAMRQSKYDPAYLNATREAALILVFSAAALLYTVLYCRMFAYDRDPASITLYFGIPDWALWGVIAPWVGCALFTVWFCFWFMKEDELTPPAGGARSNLDAPAPERQAVEGALEEGRADVP